MTELKQITDVIQGDDEQAIVHIREVMADFQCHKVVMAAVIKEICPLHHSELPYMAMVIGLPGTDLEMPYKAPTEMYARFTPTVGDYVVLYENDYVAISPKQPFEDGYTQLNFVDIGDEEEIFVPEGAIDQINELARLAHGVLMQYSLAYGSELKPWEEVCEKDQKHLVSRIAHFMTYPDAEAGAPHESWRMRISLSGWTQGPFNADRKTRPDLCFFSQLPQEQQACDFIIKGLVHETFHKN